MSPGPGVPLRGNYSARRGSVSAASCFLSLSLSVATGSIPGEHAWLITTLNILYVNVRMPVFVHSHAILHVCVLPHAFTGFISCLFHSLTDSICASTDVCVFVHMPALCHSVCVLPLTCLTPHLLVSSQQAFH